MDLPRALARNGVAAALIVASVALLLVPAAASGAPAAGPEAVVTVAPIEAPASTKGISLVSSSTANGWRYDSYRNLSAPCSISGYQTFTIASKVGVPADEVHPLWVFAHGGGVGFFAPDGQPVGGTKWLVEEGAASQRSRFVPTTKADANLMGRIQQLPVGFRMMTLSMCNHDAYGGAGIADPYNPHTTPDGKTRTVNGFVASKAAVEFALQTNATDDFVLLGGSAGSAGIWPLAWGLEQQGIAPTAVIGDSGVLNRRWRDSTRDLECGSPADADALLEGRIHPSIVDPANQPDQLVVDGKLTVPLLHVWSMGDKNVCGTEPIACTLLDGSSATMGSADCVHELLRAAIEQVHDPRSANVRLCVSASDAPGSCNQHVSTGASGKVNTIGPWPSDYNGAIVQWVTDRLGDDGTGPPSDRTTTASFATAARTDFLGAAPSVRRVEADGFALDAGLARATYLARLSTSDEWLAAVVDRLYRDTLGRPGDPSGTAFWIGQLRSGRRTVAGAAASFYASNEYYRGFGGGTDRTWVTDLYEKLLDRAPDPGGLDYWVRQTASAGRDSVARRFFQSPESARTRVAGLYQQLLDRAPDPSGLAHWSRAVVTDGDLALAVQLAASNEYRNRAAIRFP